MTEQCFVCGNSKEDEIEYKRVTLDRGWKEVKEMAWVCKDLEACGMRMYGNKN